MSSSDSSSSSSRSSCSESEFVSARGGGDEEEEDQDHSKMGSGTGGSATDFSHEDMFENSTCEDTGTGEEGDGASGGGGVDGNGNRGGAASASASSMGSHTSQKDVWTEEDKKHLWAALPKGLELEAMCTKATGLLFIERYQSFVYQHWPYDVRNGNLCHPKALAMAGLGFYSLEPTPSAQCQVCLTVLKNLQPNSNPWILHSEAKPDCILIKWGQRQTVDDYTMKQLLQMAYTKIYNLAEQSVKDKENDLKRQLNALRELELEREREKEQASASSNA